MVTVVLPPCLRKCLRLKTCAAINRWIVMLQQARNEVALFNRREIWGDTIAQYEVTIGALREKLKTKYVPPRQRNRKKKKEA